MKVACIMMERNENLLLRNWVTYHGALFGYENLFVFDNGSDDQGVKDDLEQLSDNFGINVDYSRSSKKDFEAKGDIIVQTIRALEQEGDYDLFIPLDCDEFVCVQSNGITSFERKDILSELKNYIKNPAALRMPGCFYNCYGRDDYYYYLDVQKTFFARGAAGHLDVGYHDGTSRLSSESVTTSIKLIHLHNKPFETVKLHARMKLEARVKSMNPQDLQEYRGPGEHLIRYFLWTENEYINSFPKNSAVHMPEFSKKMKLLATPLPF
jgi:hypothetical protein